jgi:DNA modification methylase
MAWEELKSKGIKLYYEEESTCIINSDCRDVLPQLDKVDLVLTDPPYTDDFMKLDYSTGRKHHAGLAGIKHLYISDELSNPPSKEDLDLIRKSSQNQIIFGGNYFADRLPPSSCWLVWDKETAGNFADCELCWTSFTYAVRKFTFKWSGMLQEDMKNKEFRYHPTQKPVGLLKQIVTQYGNNAQIILDSYMGSGSTLIASKQLGVKSIGIEISEKYCEIAVKRLQQSVMNFDIPKEEVKQQPLMELGVK